jgi:hypothetical protein
MKKHYLRFISSLLIILLLISITTNANKISNKKSDIIIYHFNQSSLEGDLDPNVNIKIKVTIKEIRAFDELDKRSEADFYVKVFINDEKFISPVWRNRNVVYDHWEVELDVPDDEELVDIVIQLWEKDLGRDTLCDIARNDNINTDRYDLNLKYSIKNGHWLGDDFISIPHMWYPDYSGYGRGSGTDDNTISEHDNDCEIWFDITQTDSDGDNIPYWCEVNEFNTDPLVDDTGLDQDFDGIPYEWEFKWGQVMYIEHHTQELERYWYYSPVEYNDHFNLDPDGDSIDNYEEYLTSEWNSDPYRKDIFVELDEMEAGPNGEPECTLPDGAKELIFKAFNRQNIIFHLDDGEMGGYELIPFDNDGDNTTREECDRYYYDYFLHGNEQYWKRGVFHYGLVVYNATWPGWTYRIDAFQISYKHLEKFNRKLLTGPRNVIFASDYMHELGHTLGLTWLGGHSQGSGLLYNLLFYKYLPYKSIMNYAYMYGLYKRNLVDYSDGSRGKNDFDDWSNIDYTYFDYMDR